MRFRRRTQLLLPAAVQRISRRRSTFPNNATPGTYHIKISTQDTTGSPSHSFTLAVTLAQDFLVTSSTPSQSVTAGQTSGPYNLTVQPVGSTFSGAVTLACSPGLPAQAQCVFSPSTPVTPENSAVNVVMNISTTASKSTFQARQRGVLIFDAFYLLLPGIMIGWAGAERDSQSVAFTGCLRSWC